jgi:hypothetical protein
MDMHVLMSEVEIGKSINKELSMTVDDLAGQLKEMAIAKEAAQMGQRAMKVYLSEVVRLSRESSELANSFESTGNEVLDDRGYVDEQDGEEPVVGRPVQPVNPQTSNHFPTTALLPQAHPAQLDWPGIPVPIDHRFSRWQPPISLQVHLAQLNRSGIRRHRDLTGLPPSGA